MHGAIRAMPRKRIYNIKKAVRLATLFRFFCIMSMLLCVSCLAACTPRPVFNSAETSRLQEPKINIYLKPAGHFDMSTARVLMGQMRPVSLNQTERPYAAMTRLVEDIFLQSKLFAELDVAADPNLSLKRLIDLGLARRFDYIMLADASIFYPSGNSRGWVGLDLKFIDTTDSIIIWRLYGEVDLLPRYGDGGGIASMFYQRSFKKAPDPAQGLAAIARSMADLMRESMTSPLPPVQGPKPGQEASPCPGN